jgi:cytochrome P450
MLLEICVAIIVVVVAYLLWPRKGFFPGPTQFGVLRTSLQSVWHMMPRRHRWYGELFKRYGPCVDVSIIGQRIVIVCDPEDVKLLHDRRLFPDRTPFGGLPKAFPNGLLGLQIGEQHSKHRRLLAPLMNESMMASYAAIIDKIADKAVALIDAKAGEPINMVAMFGDFAFDVIGQTAFNTDFGMLDSSPLSVKFKTAIDDVLRELTRLFFVPWATDTKLKKSFRVFDDEADKLRDSFARHGNEIQRTMLSELLIAEQNGELTRDETDSELRVILLAGSETTGLTIAWLLYDLAKHPKVHDKLRSLKGAEQSAYFKNLLAESQRHHPVAFGTGRDLAVPYVLHGVELPAGTNVTVVWSTTNFDPRTWGDDVDEFRPERFDLPTPLPEHIWSPFGFGVRKCIGARFAQLESEIAVLRIAAEFRITVVQEPVERLMFTMHPHGLKLAFERFEK